MSEYGFVNYYQTLGIDRQLSEEEIKQLLGEKEKVVHRRSRTTPRDRVEIIEALRLERQQIREARDILTNKERRKQYDLELDQRYKENTIDHVVTEQIRSIIEKARYFFTNENYEMAAKFAQEAIDNELDNDEPYELLCRSQFIMGDYDEALDTVDRSSLLYQGAATLRWLQIRLRILMEEFDDAQRCLNDALSILPNDVQLHAEQVFLYYAADQVSAGEREMHDYLNEHPNDMQYRQYVAYGLIEIANRCYVYDSAADMMLITEEAAYNTCRNLVTLANQIYQDDYVKTELENANKYGEMIFDEDHKGIKRFYNVMCALFILLCIPLMQVDEYTIWLVLGSLAIAFLFFLGGCAVKKLSYRPAWKVNRDHYRGFKEDEDGALFQLLWFPYSFIEAIFGK